MSCPTIADAPWFGRTPCSSHGFCDIQTSLCTCDEGYSGAGDLFDLQVAADGIQASDCALSLLGVRITWAITFAFMLFRSLTAIAALSLHLRTRQSKRITAVTQVLLLDIFINHPLFCALVVLKLFYGQIIGTDSAVTIAFAIGVPSAFFSINHFSVHEFRVIQVTEESEIFQRFRKSAYMAPVLYFLLASIPTMVSLLLDKTKGPIASGQVVILLFRIMMVCFFQVVGLRNAMRFAKEAAGILEAQSGNPQNSATRAKVMRIVEYMNNQALAFKKKAIVLLLLHLPFLTPYLWPQQAILIGMSISLISLSNPSMSILRMRWASRAVENDKVSQSPETSRKAMQLSPSSSHHTEEKGRI